MQSAQGMTPSFSLSSQDVADSLSSLPQISAPADDAASPYSTLVLVPYSAPAPQETTFPPLNWHKIPQKAYDVWRKQWTFEPQEPIPFTVSGRPGLNMGDALCKRFMGLEGRDDLVLQDVGNAISCRLLVRLSDNFHFA